MRGVMTTFTRAVRVTCHFSVRGRVIGQRASHLIGRSAQGSCSEGIHMEEEKVEVKVQEEEVGDRERRKGEQSEGRRENRQPLKRMTHG